MMLRRPLGARAGLRACLAAFLLLALLPGCGREPVVITPGGCPGPPTSIDGLFLPVALGKEEHLTARYRCGSDHRAVQAAWTVADTSIAVMLATSDSTATLRPRRMGKTTFKIEILGYSIMEGPLEVVAGP